MPAPLSLDTDPEIEARLIEAWRSMTPAEKAVRVAGLSHAARTMAYAGIRARFPDAPPHEQALRLAVVLLGPELAAQAYPDTATLDR